MDTDYRRIVCLTEETTETLYLLGQESRIVGISGFTVRPLEARRDKPKVSAFTSARIEKILALEPDLAIGFSDIQAEVAAALIRHGIEIHVFNQRSISEILRMIESLGRMVNCFESSRRLVQQFAANLETMKRLSNGRRRPKIYFEEWDEPMISCIRWVSELIEIAGGQNVFPELSMMPMARDRIVQSPQVVVARNPDIIIGSWCGKKFRPDKVKARVGFEKINAVKTGQLYEIKSSLILQPGPAALTDGVSALKDIIYEWGQNDC